MTLDEAIKTQERVAKQMEENLKSFCLNNPQDNNIVELWQERARYHRQMAAWLKELKDRRDFINIVINALKEDAEIRQWDYSPYDAISLIKALASDVAAINAVPAVDKDGENNDK